MSSAGFTRPGLNCKHEDCRKNFRYFRRDPMWAKLKSFPIRSRQNVRTASGKRLTQKPTSELLCHWGVVERGAQRPLWIGPRNSNAYRTLATCGPHLRQMQRATDGNRLLP